MARDLGQFALRIQALGKRLPGNVDRIVVLAAQAVNQTVVVATPVDTGRARANWQVGIGDPETEVLLKEDQGGQQTINENNTKIQSRRSGQTIFISNNVAYIRRLNEGSSSQAPAGFVEEAVAVGLRAIRARKVLD